MNNNNENQNLNPMNPGVNNGMVGTVPTPTPMPAPTPTPSSVTIGDPMGGVVPQSAQPISEPVVAPQPTPAPTTSTLVGTIPEPTPGIVATPTESLNVESQPVQPQGSINLAPEGVVVPQEVVQSPVQQQTVEPLMSSTLTEQTVLNPTPLNTNDGSLEQPQVSPMGGMTPPVNNMGMMGGIPAPPAVPQGDNGKKGKDKKKISPIMIVLILVLIAAVGFGVYYFLFMGKSKNSIVITPLNTEIELGSTMILDSAVSYVKVSGMSASECKVTNTNVDPTKVGTYEYTITCGSKVFGPTKVSVKDTKAPVVVFRDITIVPDNIPSAEDLVESVDDASSCSYEFVENIDEIDFSTPGTYTVTIKVIDAYENETSGTAKITVDPDAPVEFLYCEAEGEGSSKYSDASVFVTYRYGVTDAQTINGIQKIYNYSFSTEEEYLAALEDITDSGFDNIKGKVKKEAKSYTISVVQDTTDKVLEKEFNLTPFPSSSIDIEDYHMTQDEMCYVDVE